MCHKKYSFNITQEESNLFDSKPFRNEDCATIPDNKIIHNCKNGILGVAELQGFKKVGD
jgi:hypothetical protein